MNQIIMILLISILILVHEFGHYIAARLCGIRVTRFGIGMPIGPGWKLFKLGHTNFYFHAFIFGGYVSFADDEKNFRDENKDEDTNEEELLPSDSPELYENKTIFQKLFVVSAGIIMNVVFAIFLVLFTATIYHKLPASTQNLYVNGFSDKITSNAQNMGIKKGDKFKKINSHDINTYYKLIFFAKNSKLFDDYAEENLIDENLIELKKLNPDLSDDNEQLKIGQTVFLPTIKEENKLDVNENVLKGLEKYKKTGIELNKNQINLRDKIYSKKSYTIEENDIEENITLKDIAYALSDTYKPMEITVLRDEKEVIIKNVIVDKEGLLGVLLKIEDIYTATKTPKNIIINSFNYTYNITSTMLFSLWQLFTGKVSASDMHGVIAIVKVGGDIIAAKGMLNGLLLTAFISINLAIMNFLPIPALDGGHIMFLIVEKITGKKPSRELGDKINNFFFTLLIILMLAICYNDIAALVMKKF